MVALSKHATEHDVRLEDVQKLKVQMEERFHLFEEVKALPAEDQDALFKLLWEAQAGDSSGLESIYELVYDEIPVDMEEFVLGAHYLGLRGLINTEKLDILCRFDRPEVRKAFVAAGSGGGKSFMVSIAMARQVYKLLCLKRPDMYYMLGPGSKIAVINLSVSKEQARDVIFSEFIARVEPSRWFSSTKWAKWTTKARFPKGVYVMSGGSNATVFYGYHTIFGSLDEASFLLDHQERSVAEELCEALLKSLNTRFPRAYKLWVISTLRSVDDFLMTRIDQIRETGVRVA